MIARVWHGWTTPSNADRYERLLREEVFPGIEAKGVPGYLGIELGRRTLEDGTVEFLTTMWFDSIEDVRAFAGEDYRRAYVPERARALLADFDAHSTHYEVRERRRS